MRSLLFFCLGALSVGLGTIMVHIAVAQTPTGLLMLAPIPTASLTACSAANKYQIYLTSDAAATPVYNATPTGSGTGSVMVICDGTSWRNR